MTGATPPSPATALAGNDELTMMPTGTNARRRLVLLMAAITTVIEILSVAGLIPLVQFGELKISIGLIPALGLAAVCGERLLGRSSNRRIAIGYWISVAVLLPVLGVVFWRLGHLGLWASLIAAALSEELIYRLAVPAIAAAGLRCLGTDDRRARIGGLAIGGIWFVTLPGHLDQMHNPLQLLPFAAYAALAALMVYRSGSVLPMAAGHAVINLLTVLVWSEKVAHDARGMALACVLGLLVLAYGRPRRLTIGDDGTMIDTTTGLPVSVIDLRDGVPATVTLTDGTEIEVHADLVIDTSTPRRHRSAGAALTAG